MSDIITGTVVETYQFRADQIESMGLTTVYSIQEVANILAANVELPGVEEDGTVDINESNFNDCYEDMLAELRGENDSDEDDEG